MILWFYNDNVIPFVIKERKNDKNKIHLNLYKDFKRN